MLDEEIIIVGDVWLNLAVGPPNGKPVLLLPGFTSTWTSFQPILPALIPDWYVHALDYRGHGKSARMPGQYRALDYLDDARCAVRQYFDEPVVILGNSMGGWLALSLAETMPEHVRAIIVGDTALDIEGFIPLMAGESVREFYRALQEVAGRPADEIMAVLATREMPHDEAEQLSQLDPHVLDLQVAGDGVTYFEGVTSVDLHRIMCPTLLIQGNPALGGMLSDEDLQRALSIMPIVSHVRIKHAGHDLGFSKGDVAPYLEAIQSFLDLLSDH